MLHQHDNPIPKNRQRCSRTNQTNLKSFSFNLILVVVLLLLSTTTTTTTAQTHQNLPPNYYDLLRTSSSEWASPPLPSPDSSSFSNVIEYNTLTSKKTYRLAHIASFLAYTSSVYVPATDADYAGIINNRREPIRRAGVRENAAAALIAIDLFNNGRITSVLSNLSPSVLSSYEKCNVRLTAEFQDTMLSPIAATETLTSILDRPKNTTTTTTTATTTTPKELPRPSAVLGSYRDASTSPLAILSGVHNIIQVGFAASSSDLNIKQQYPLYGRTVPSSTEGDARAIVSFFTSRNIKHLGILFVTDGFGSAYQKALQDAAGEAGIQTNSHSFSFTSVPLFATDDDSDENNNNNNTQAPPSSSSSQSQVAPIDNSEIHSALLGLKNTEYRYFIAIVGDEQYKLIMHEATEMGLIGEDYVWFFTSGLDLRTFQRDAEFLPGSKLANATKGIGILHVEPTTTTRHIPPPTLVDPFRQPPLPPTSTPPSSYDKFNDIWYQYITNATMTSYIDSKQAEGFQNNEDGYSSHPNHHSYFIFDAVMSLGLSMCMTPSSSSQDDQYYFTGQNVFEKFTSQELTFEGATGTVKFNPETGSREESTVVYTAWNVRQSKESNKDGNAVFDLVPSEHYKNDKWTTVPGNEFVFYDGSTNPPPSLPPVDMQYNYIDNTSRIVGYVFVGIIGCMSLVFMGWAFWFRFTRVVQTSKILFLGMVSIGCVIMACAIVPLGIEDDEGSPGGLEYSCMLQLWLFFMGLITVFAGLLAKTRAVAKVLKDPDMTTISIKTKDLLLCWFIIFILNFLLLIIWTTVSPLEWVRIEKESEDPLGRKNESYGKCTGDNSTAFWVCLLILDIGLLLYANWISYRTRNVQTEYHESRYISISMASMLQALCMGIPIVLVVKDTPKARYFVMAGIIFVMCCAILLLIFVPKIIALRNDKKEEAARDRSRRLAEYSKRRMENQFDDGPDDDDNDIEARTPEGKAPSDDMLTVNTNPQDPESAAKTVAFDDANGNGFGGMATTDIIGTGATTGSSAENENSTCRIVNVKESRKESFASSQSAEDGEVVGIRVTRNPVKEKIETNKLKQQLAEAKLENARLQNENKKYENELNNLLKES